VDRPGLTHVLLGASRIRQGRSSVSLRRASLVSVSSDSKLIALVAETD
jgi:hypothetical protein